MRSRRDIKGLEIRTPAKINLFLKIEGRRSDGYHNILSILQMVGLYDYIVLQDVLEGIRLICDNEDVPRDKKNLAFIAAKKMIQRDGNRRGVVIRIMKRIPVAAGLGGGSSDAAAVMIGLNRMWNLGYTRDELKVIGEDIGSDLPFFFYGPTALAMGKGDELYPIRVDERWIVLVNPDIKVSTRWVYDNLSLEWGRGGRTQNRPLIEKIGLTKYKNHNRILDFKRFFNGGDPSFNDLEGITIGKYPVIKRIKDELDSMGSEWSVMTGSGPTVFGIFKTERDALITRDTLLKRGDWRVWAVKTLKRSPYQEVWGVDKR